MFDEKQYRKEYYLKNKEKILERQKTRSVVKKDYIKSYQKQFYSTKDGRITRSIASAKKRAKDKNLQFDLDLEFLRSIAPDYCPIFNLLLDWSGWGEKNQTAIENSPSLDRIDCTKGYTKDNVIWLSWKANRLKNNASSTDLYKIADWLKQQERKIENGKTEQT